MKIDFEDRTWQVELMDIDMRQGDVILAFTGLPILAWYKSILDADAPGWNKSVRCLYWLMHDQNDDPVDLDANFRPLALFAAFNDAMEAENAPAAEEDPTRPAGERGAEEPKLPPASPAG